MEYALYLLVSLIGFIILLYIAKWVLGIGKIQAHQRAQTQLLMYIAASVKGDDKLTPEYYEDLNYIMKANGISDEVKMFKEGVTP